MLEVNPPFLHSSKASDKLLKCAGVAVGVGEVEVENIKELNEVRRELQGVIVALSEAKDENYKLRLRLAKYEPDDVTCNPVTHQQS